MNPPSPKPPDSRPSDPPRIDWAATLAEHARWLRVVVLARVGEPQAVDEVMQEVALAAVAQRAPIADRTRLGAWLHRIAVRQSMLYRRGLGRRKRREARVAGSARPGDGGEGDPLDWLVRSERSGLIRMALDRLPPRDAEILLLKYAEDLTYRELADRLDLTASAVEARLHRARGRLRAELTTCRVIEVSE